MTPEIPERWSYRRSCKQGFLFHRTLWQTGEMWIWQAHRIGKMQSLRTCQLGIWILCKMIDGLDNTQSFYLARRNTDKVAFQHLLKPSKALLINQSHHSVNLIYNQKPSKQVTNINLALDVNHPSLSQCPNKTLDHSPLSFLSCNNVSGISVSSRKNLRKLCLRLILLQYLFY